MDVTPFRGQLLLQEGRKVDLAHEADALRVLALGRGQSLLGGDAPHLGFEQGADGEQGVAQLLLRELAEEVALILVGVGAREEFIDCPSVGQRLLGLAAVVPRGDEIGAQPERFAQEDVEFDFAVAQHVGVGRASLFVFREHVIDHAGAVVRREVDDVQRDVQFLATSSAKTRSSCHGQSPSSVPVVSCQLIMNNPTTSCPCCLSRYAATDESTPPESPITTRAIVILLFTGRAALRAAPVSSCAPRSRYGR